MRLKHTGIDFYMVCSSFKGVSNEIWISHKGYSTKQAAMNGIKRIKAKRENDARCKNYPLRFRIIWCPYPFAYPDERVVVYEED